MRAEFSVSCSHGPYKVFIRPAFCLRHCVSRRKLVSNFAAGCSRAVRDLLRQGARSYLNTSLCGRTLCSFRKRWRGTHCCSHTTTTRHHGTCWFPGGRIGYLRLFFLQGWCHGRVQTCRPMGACIACLVISVGGVCGRCWS